MKISKTPGCIYSLIKPIYMCHLGSLFFSLPPQMLIMRQKTMYCTTSLKLFLSIVFFINFTICDGRNSLEVSGFIGLIGSQLQSSQNTKPPPYGFISNPTPFSLPPNSESVPSPLSQPNFNTIIPPSFCLLPPPSTAVPLPPQRIHPPQPPLLPKPGVPTTAPALPSHVPTPPKHELPPPAVCEPPLGPPLMVPPPPPQEHNKAPTYAVWCVAKPTVPEAVMQEAMDYACGSGSDCKPIQSNGPCYLPDTLLAHASFALNSYFQNKKGSGGTCDFGGTAMLVTVDPSYNGCHFIFI